MNDQERNFLIGCTLGDGCIRKDSRRFTYTFVLSRCARHKEYASWQLSQINKILDSKANLHEFMDKGKYPAVRFGASNKKLLSEIYDYLYFDGTKMFTEQTLSLLGIKELALFC